MVGGTDLTFPRDLRQIRVAVHTARPSARVQAADRQHYRESVALPVVLQVSSLDSNGQTSSVYRKSVGAIMVQPKL